MAKKKIEKVEYRDLSFNLGSNLDSNVESTDIKANIVEGKAICFNEPTVLYKDHFGNTYKEVILPEAINGCDLSSVTLCYNHNHEKAKALAKQKNDTLQIEVKEDGVYFIANLKTNLGKDVYQQIQDGELSKCSFGFVVADDEYDTTSFTRVIKQFAKITDISIVDDPAYGTTNVSARDYFSAKAEIVERAHEQEERNRLLAMLG